MNKSILTLFLTISALASGTAQTFEHISTTENQRWMTKGKLKVATSPIGEVVRVNPSAPIVTFDKWGTTFNEQDWKALSMLSREEQNEILHNAFSPDGDLKLNMGRISMNANDYAVSWFSCSDVPGDFDLKYFNIERDKMAIIPYIRAAQKFNPDLTFWMSPWSPPAWMKINNHYAVQSNRSNDMDPRQDCLLFGDNDRSDNEQVNPDKNLFPRRMAVQDYMIQSPRYLQCYADMFCRFIDLYAQQGINIDMVMYQNEAYSYTAYPGCPWTTDGILRFNLEYLSPTLQSKHPEVELYLGTFNTNRYDHVKALLEDSRMVESIKGIGFQWEGGQILPRIREAYPDYRYSSSESECGNGLMNWEAAEHTFHLINHYLGNGCSEYNNWNLILCDQGESAWGWRQNALIRVKSEDRTFEYVPEYYTYKHYSNFIQNGSNILSVKPTGIDKTPVLVALTPEKKYVVVAGNFNDNARNVSIEINGKYLNLLIDPHSMNTFVQK